MSPVLWVAPRFHTKGSLSIGYEYVASWIGLSSRFCLDCLSERADSAPAWQINMKNKRVIYDEIIFGKKEFYRLSPVRKGEK